MIPSRQTTDTKTPENALREFFHRVRPAGVASVFLYGSAPGAGCRPKATSTSPCCWTAPPSFPRTTSRGTGPAHRRTDPRPGEKRRRPRHSQRRTPRPRAPCNNRGDSGVRGGPRGGSRLLPGRPAARRGSRLVPAANAADEAQGPLLVTWLVERLAELRKHLDHLRMLEPKVEGAESLRNDLSLHNDVLFSLLTGSARVSGELCRSKDWQKTLRELPDPGGALSALTGSPKRCHILLILGDDASSRRTGGSNARTGCRSSRSGSKKYLSTAGRSSSA